MRRVLSFVGALAVSYLSLRIWSPLIPFALNFFDQGTPDPSEAAKSALDLLLTAHGVLAIGLFGLLKRSQKIAEGVGNFLNTVKF